MSSKKVWRITVSSIGVAAALCIGLYALIVWEGSSAREDAPALESSVAQWLLHYTVPAGFRAMKNPLDVGAGSADVEAGHEVYTQKCEICHAYDGAGKTEIGSGQYPRPPDLRGVDVQRISDGELYYHLKNGIRHTGLDAARSQTLAAERIPAPSAEGRRFVAPSCGCRGGIAGRRHRALRGFSGLQRLSYGDLRSLEEDPHGQCGPRSARPSGGDHSRFFKAGSAPDF
jgi:mono/diheme cytochrome c family protein